MPGRIIKITSSVGHRPVIVRCPIALSLTRNIDKIKMKLIASWISTGTTPSPTYDDTPKAPLLFSIDGLHGQETRNFMAPELRDATYSTRMCTIWVCNMDLSVRRHKRGYQTSLRSGWRQVLVLRLSLAPGAMCDRLRGMLDSIRWP